MFFSYIIDAIVLLVRVLYDIITMCSQYDKKIKPLENTILFQLKHREQSQSKLSDISPSHRTIC